MRVAAVLKLAAASALAAACAGQQVIAVFSDASCTVFTGNITIPFSAYSPSVLPHACWNLSDASNVAMAALRGSNDDGPPPVQYAGWSTINLPQLSSVGSQIFSSFSICQTASYSLYYVASFPVSTPVPSSCMSAYSACSSGAGSAGLCAGSYSCVENCAYATPSSAPTPSATISPPPSYAPGAAPTLYVVLYQDSNCITTGIGTTSNSHNQPDTNTPYTGGTWWSTIEGTCSNGTSGILSGSTPGNWPIISSSTALYSYSDTACTVLSTTATISSSYCGGNNGPCPPSTCSLITFPTITNYNAPNICNYGYYARTFSVLPTCSVSSYRQLPRMDVFGTLLTPSPLSLPSEMFCLAACCATPSCTAYSFVASGLNSGIVALVSNFWPPVGFPQTASPCYLYSNITALVPSSGMSSGALYSAYS